MIVVPKNPDAGQAMNLLHVFDLSKEEASSALVGTTKYLIKFQQEHRIKTWEFLTEIERDTAWDDIMGTPFVRVVGLPKS